MSKKNRIFAAAIAVLLLVLTSMSTFAGFRLYFYELDFKYDEKRQTFSFTSVADATYYEIRGFAPGEIQPLEDRPYRFEPLPRRPHLRLARSASDHELS